MILSCLLIDFHSANRKQFACKFSLLMLDDVGCILHSTVSSPLVMNPRIVGFGFLKGLDAFVSFDRHTFLQIVRKNGIDLTDLNVSRDYFYSCTLSTSVYNSMFSPVSSN